MANSKSRRPVSFEQYKKDKSNSNANNRKNLNRNKNYNNNRNNNYNNNNNNNNNNNAPSVSTKVDIKYVRKVYDEYMDGIGNSKSTPSASDADLSFNEWAEKNFPDVKSMFVLFVCF